MTNLINQNQTENNLEKLEGNSEQKEQFDKNSREFQDKYEQKLKNILPEDLVKKISGSFELNWDIENIIDNLKNNGLSPDSINFIKNNINDNISIPKEKLNQIAQELDNSSNEKNLDLRLWDIIWKATRKAEESENDDLFNKVMEARKIQQNWNANEKSRVLIEIENLLSWNKKIEESIKIENTNEEKKSEENFSKNNENQVQTLAEVWVESEDTWNEKWYFEEGLIIWDMFSKDKQPESNDYGNIQVEQKQNIFQKWSDFLKWNNLENNNKNQESQEKWNSEFSPILENLKNIWEISNEQFQKINKDLWWKNSEEQQNIFRNFIDKLPNSDNKTNILQNFNKNKENVTEENFDKTLFSSDIKWKVELDKSIWWLETMLAENYIYIWNKESWQEKNKEDSINSVMEVTKNKLIKSKSTDFKNNNAELISEISTEKNLNVKYQKLKKLYKEWLKEDAKAWWKKWKEEMDRKKENLIWEYKETLENIKKAQENWNKEELDKLNKQKEKIEQEAKQTQNTIEELDKITKETDLDIWNSISEENNTKKE